MISDYLGDFVIREEDKVYQKLADCYHKETEDYDKGVCSLVDNEGMAIPINRGELSLINANARKVKEKIIDENPWVSIPKLNKHIKGTYYGS